MRAMVSIGSFDFPEPSEDSGTTSTLVNNGAFASVY